MSSEAQIVAVDLFCGVGGLTHGLTKAGIDVRLGVDLDPACRFPMEQNNAAKFLEADVSKLCASDILAAFGDARITLMAGCAPCQPFSSYSQPARREKQHADWELLTSFSSLVLSVLPTFVTMENVPPLQKQEIFEQFVAALKEAGYYVDFDVVDGRHIGLPQRRQRLVLVASILGPIKLPKISKPKVTVRDTIVGLSPIAAGEADANDPLHVSASLSATNLKRIRHSKPGGTWRDWPKDLVAPCHTRKTGATYPSVYGRMEWDEPAPTITTQCYGFGNGRFGHPEQDRAISLREAAMLQSFPKDYAFVPQDRPINFDTLGRLIGNAVPVLLGKYIGDVFTEYLKAHCVMPEQEPPVLPSRSALMARIGPKNSKPEMVVRRLLHALGYRFRLHAKDLPGCPDIVFRSKKKAIFVHGCFWHHHPGCKKATTPKTRVAFWTEKFERNIARDRLKETALREMGWQVLVVWECETKAIETLAAKLVAAFTPKPYSSDSDGSGDEERREYP